MKYAVLISDEKDTDWIKKNFNPKEISVYARQAHLAQIIKTIKVEEFYGANLHDDEMLGAVEKIIENWHRDDYGRDLSIKNGISWGIVLGSSLGIALPALFREIIGLIKINEIHDVIYVSKNEPKIFFEFIRGLDINIQIYDPNHRSKPLNHSINLRKVEMFPKNFFIYSVLRILQKPFIRGLKNKNLFFNCWTTKADAIKRNDSLILNGGLNIIKSAYSVSSSGAIKNNFDLQKIKSIINVEFIKKCLSDLNFIETEKIIKKICQLIYTTYQENEKEYSIIYYKFHDIYKTYSPKSIILPAFDFDAYLIASQLAKFMGVGTIMCLDGISSVRISSKRQAKLLNERLNQNNSYIYEKIIASGPSNLENFANIGIDKKRLTLVKPPLLPRNRPASNKHKIFDLMIMTHVPYDLNLIGAHSSKILTLMDCLSAAIMSDQKKVAIKIKHKAELEWVRQSIQYVEPFLDIEVIEGPFSKHCNKAKIIVGGLSTALFEAHYYSIPYIVYEPLRNGYTCSDLKGSNVIDRNFVARSKKELVSFIKKAKTSVNAGSDFMFTGPSISQINLDF